MTADLASKLEALDSSVDYSDPNTYARLLYGDEAGTATEQPQGDTQTATPAAAAPAEVTAPAAAEVPAAAPPAPAAPASSATPGAAENPDASQAVDGVLTRDGKRVIPYDVLAKTRETAQENGRRAQQLEESNRQLQAQIEALKSGKADTGQAVEVFPKERIEAARADFPEMAELMEGQNRLAAELAEARKSAPAPAAPAQPDNQQQVLQAAIDNRPLLAKWQTASQMLWHRAGQVDDALMADPVWAAKSLDERLAEVERRVADEVGVAVPSNPAAPAAAAPAAPTPPAAPAQPTAPAAPVVAAAPKPGIGDFNGSAPVVGADPLLGVPVGKAVDIAMAMSIEDVMRSVGVNV